MYRASKNNDSTGWQPTAEIETLRQRARMLSDIRAFFQERGVMEVETPVLSHATVTDPYVIGIPAYFSEIGDAAEKKCYLQTSPEYAMKRLLAAGSGAIYQITKAFRQGEIGKYHNPEFTMLEWYRPGFDHHALMDEMDVFLQRLFKIECAERITYAGLFQKYLGIDPQSITVGACETLALQRNLHVSGGTMMSVDTWLNLFMTHWIEPHLGANRPIFIYDFPASQAALAKIQNTDPPVASRFEVYFKGIELANGFHELQSADEQRKRFEQDNAMRRKHGLPVIEMDQRFLQALEYGLPACAGVALGVDRLVMLALNQRAVHDVISFTFERA